jgi:uncharacterized protein (TIGR02996 family)
MTDLQSLYAGICAQPDEDTPRLALADWLDEEGGEENQFRADLIRTHCRHAREETWSKPWRELNARWQEVSMKVADQERAGKLPWLAHLKGRVKAWAFERGLVGHLTLFSKRFVTEGDSYFEQDPIRSVKFVRLTSTMGTVKPEVLFASPHMGRIVKLDLDGSALKDGDINRLAASPCAPVLRSLTLSSYNPVGAAALPKLLKAMPCLTELDFSVNDYFGDPHAKALAKCPEFARLTSLDLGYTSLKAEGVAALVGGKHGGELTKLRLAPAYEDEDEYGVPRPPRHNRKDGVATSEALAASKHLGKLQELSLNYRDIGDEGLKLLVGAEKALPALRRLSLEACGLTLTGLKRLAESELGGRLLYLDLRESHNLAKHAAKLKKMFPTAHVEEPFDYGE